MPTDPVKRQSTLVSPVATSGIELHGGKMCHMRLLPAPIETGIRFVRTDVTDRDNIIPVRPDAVCRVKNCTTIENAAGVKVSTIEHLMAALASVGIDNLIVEISSEELPALDGSSEPFLALIEKVGITPQPAKRRYIKVLKTVEVSHGDSSAKIEPNDALMLNVTIDYEDEAIGRQSVVLKPDVRSFRDNLASARTFARIQDVDALRAAGLSKGGSFDNAVVVDGDRILNPDGLRFENEFVAHKALDLMGDLYVGGPILGKVTTERGGHALNHQLLLALFADADAWVFTNLAQNAMPKTPAQESAELTFSVA